MGLRHDAASLGDFGALQALGNPVRKGLYEAVSAAGRPVGRDEAAASVGIGRSLAAYHLDKLSEEGLLEVSFERQSGRTGPGAGRPAKLYHLAAREFVLCAPPRDYRLLSELLVRAAAADESGVVTDGLERAARELGYELGRTASVGGDDPGTAISAVLTARGFEPFVDTSGAIRLRNCPFAQVAAEHPEIVCRANLGLVEGILDGLGADEARAVLDPGNRCCCVAIEQVPPRWFLRWGNRTLRKPDSRLGST